VAVDFEFIPTFGTGDDFVLTIHPGVLYGFGGRYAVGARAAYDAGSSNDSFGITPLVSRGFRLTRTTGLVRRARPADPPQPAGRRRALHVGRPRRAPRPLLLTAPTAHAPADRGRPGPEALA
jgi:hypothetical protein